MPTEKDERAKLKKILTRIIRKCHDRQYTKPGRRCYLPDCPDDVIGLIVEFSLMGKKNNHLDPFNLSSLTSWRRSKKFI